MNPKLAWAGILLFLDFIINPTFGLFTAAIILMLIDLVTGIAKAKFQHRERTSEGYRKTVVKLLQYMVPVIVLYMGARFIPEHAIMLKKASGYLIMFICYIEATSIFENLYEMDKKSMIAKYLYRPALIVLKFGLEKNPVNNAAEKVNQQKKEGNGN